MPTYEYACKSCGEHTEVVQSFSDPPLTECPSCGGPLRKVFGTPGIVLKGSGFYKTDSRAVANGKGQPKEKEAASGGSEAGGARESTAAKDSKVSGEKGSGEKGSGEKGSGESASNGSSGSSTGSVGGGAPGGKPTAAPAAAG